jgi:hypothetical protein
MKKLIANGLVPVLVLLMLWGCTENVGEPVIEPDDEPDIELTQNTCLGCHSSEKNLKDALGGGGSYTIVTANSGDG